MNRPYMIQDIKMNSLLEHGIGNRTILPQVLLQLRKQIPIGNYGQDVILIARQFFDFALELS